MKATELLLDLEKMKARINDLAYSKERPDVSANVWFNLGQALACLEITMGYLRMDIEEGEGVNES